DASRRRARESGVDRVGVLSPARSGLEERVVRALRAEDRVPGLREVLPLHREGRVGPGRPPRRLLERERQGRRLLRRDCRRGEERAERLDLFHETSPPVALRGEAQASPWKTETPERAIRGASAWAMKSKRRGFSFARALLSTDVSSSPCDAAIAKLKSRIGKNSRRKSSSVRILPSSSSTHFCDITISKDDGRGRRKSTPHPPGELQAPCHRPGRMAGRLQTLCREAAAPGIPRRRGAKERPSD